MHGIHFLGYQLFIEFVINLNLREKDLFKINNFPGIG